MLKIRNLDAGYGKLRVLKNISLHVDPGEIVTMIGANGAGKTTLLHTIIGLIKPSKGEISFLGRSCGCSSVGQIVASGCALVPENRQVFASMSVEENLLLGGHVLQKREGGAAVQRELQHQYQLFPILEERRHQLAGTLSGGEQQMLAMGRALMSKPRLVMMDEPSTGLAPLIVRDIFAIIKRLRDEGTTVLLIEQNAKAALKIADFGYVMETGNITLSGTGAELLNDPRVQSAYLGSNSQHKHA